MNPNKKTQILVIDDRDDIRLSLSLILEDNGYGFLEASNPKAAQEMLKKDDIALILLDMNFALDTTSGEEGLTFLKWLQDTGINIPTITMTAWSNVDLAVKAMQLGARDFIEKPWKNKRLLQVIEQQLAISNLEAQNTKLKQRLSEHTQTEYQWRSECMLKLLKKIEAVANADVSILLTGDNGTGKSELARAIHQQSQRHDEAFIEVNMGAITESLFESEIFGHKKGAFTDAKSNRMGRFELAEGGTLFLDEIANIPLSQQTKLLRVLESSEYEVLGSSKTLKTDVRIISATNADIPKLIEQERFREDLYYRLNTIEFHIPTLQQRHQDIIPLAEFFMALFREQYDRSELSISDAAKAALHEYHWPGNIRELSHIIERASCQ